MGSPRRLCAPRLRCSSNRPREAAIQGSVLPHARSARIFGARHSTLSVNATEDEAQFTVNTTTKNGMAYSEKGTLRKDANGKWKLAIYPTASDTAALFTIANPNESSTELMRNIQFAIDWVLAARGIPEYQLRAAQYLYDGVMSDKDFEEYYRMVSNAANKGNQDAMLKQASALEEGIGVKKDLYKSFEIYKKLAELGNADGMYNLAYSYREGEGTPKDYEEALKWGEKALAAGSNDANLHLGYMYSKAIGVPKDHQKAYEYYVKGAEGGNSNCMVNIGVDYHNGYAVPKDLKKAEEWYKKAYEANNRYATRQLGDLYYYDLKDYDKAFYYYKKLADKENNYGEYMVGCCYEYGRGVSRNLSTAREWYLKGWRKDYAPAVKAYHRL